jgi:DNA-binding transcriptional ArsR family regulator
MDEVTLEGILHALSDPVRLAIFADIVQGECAPSCSSFLTVNEKVIPKSTLSQHFKALREAGLIRGERQGVEMHNTPRCAELQERFPGLMAAISGAYMLQVQRNAAAKRKTRRKRSPAAD